MELIKAIDQIHPLPPSLSDEIAERCTASSFQKGHHLLDFWEIDKHLHFIVKGSGRVYYLKDGQDVTDYIAMDGQFLGGVESVFTQTPSHKAIELTETSLVQSIKHHDLEQLAEKHHAVETLYRKMMTWAFLECQQRIESLRFMSAADRYHALEAKYPNISNRIPLKHLASYLSTTQVSLSRIRAGKQ